MSIASWKGEEVSAANEKVSIMLGNMHALAATNAHNGLQI